MPGASQATTCNRTQAATIPYRDSRSEDQQSPKIMSQENETAPALPRHDQTHWWAGRLEPDAQRLQTSAERGQTGEREGGGEGYNSPGHAPTLLRCARRTLTSRAQCGAYERVAVCRSCLATRPVSTAFTSGAESKRTGSVTGSPVSCAAAWHARRAAASGRS